MNSSWFTLHSNTFLWIKEDKGLIYNTANSLSFSFSLTQETKNLCTVLLDPSSLYTVEIKEDVKNRPEVREWIDRILAIDAGTLIEKKNSVQRPVELLPICKVQDNVGHYSWLHSHNSHGTILDNLHELYFLINGSQYGDDEYLRQTTFPLKNSTVLDFNLIKAFIYRVPILSIHLVGDIFSYPDYLNTVAYLSEEGFYPTIDCIVSDIRDTKKLKELCAIKNVTLNVIYPPMAQESILERWISEHAENLSLTFLITDEFSYENSYPTLQENRRNSKIIPIYNGDNISFFKENIFLTSEDLENAKLTKRSIFSHQLLNSNYFGSLYILPDGAVHSNLNSPALGTIHEHLHDIVYKEMKDGNSWLSTRDSAPCNNCVYQWICPPPSNYEAVIGKPNLCLLNE